MTSILITGGTGSFGQAFTKHLLTLQAVDRIVIYSRGEHLQEQMAQSISDKRMRFFIGDVRDRDRLEMAMRGVDIVVHAAALKIVPSAEYNPTECVATNVYGAENVVKAALRSDVQKVVALSTDKAVNPINLYGATKLAAEKIFLAANALAAGQCTFGVVRYGNVSCSRGSVIPYFRKLKSEGKPLTITHPDMTRFHIEMSEAIQLVLASIESGGNAVLVPKIPSVKVVDIAEAIDPGGERVTIGIRPGEKLHEVLVTEHEMEFAVSDATTYRITPNQRSLQLHDIARYTSDTNHHFLTVEEIRGRLDG